MVTPDTAVVATLVLLDTPQFEPFVKYLTALREDARDALETYQDEAVLRQMQGRAWLAKDLLESIRSSRELMTKLQQ